jgi:putative ABC transport system permease protein
MTLLLVFGGVALSLAAIGVYGVISYSISERTHELGLRRALGATAGNVLGMVLRQGMTVAGAGVVMGVLGAFWLTGFMSSLLYDVGARYCWRSWHWWRRCCPRRGRWVWSRAWHSGKSDSREK